MGLGHFALDHLVAEEGQQHAAAGAGPERHPVAHPHHAADREQAFKLLEADAVFSDDAVERHSFLALVPDLLHVRIDDSLRTEVGLGDAAEQVKLAAERIGAVAVTFEQTQPLKRGSEPEGRGDRQFYALSQLAEV